MIKEILGQHHFFYKSMVDLSLENYLNSILKVNYQKTTNDNYLKKFNLESKNHTYS